MKFFYLKTFYPFVVLFFAGMFYLGLEASEPKEISAEQALLKQLKSLGTFQSSYQQGVFNEQGEQIESAQGQFYLGSNKAFRNDVNQPEKSRVVSDGTSLWLIDDDLEQVSISPLSAYLADSPLALLLDKTESALKAYQVRDIGDSSSKASLFELEAEEGYNAIKAIRIAFKAKQVDYIEIDERRGRKIRVDFTSVKALKNTKVFKANFPSHYDVVDETQ